MSVFRFEPTIVPSAMRDRARDLERIDRILELSRRSRMMTSAVTENTIDEERHRRILTTLRRERELRETSDRLARRSLERTHTVMERAREIGRAHV